MDEFAYSKTNINGTFVVKNIATSRKTIRIFDYPIPYNTTRDLLAIPGVSEASIRASLLKGEIKVKLQALEAIVISSDVDLLQFNDNQYNFLAGKGISKGLAALSSSSAVKKDLQLIGAANGINTIFTLPTPDVYFIQTTDKKIIVYLNGVKQFLSVDFIVAEGGGTGTGYDRVVFTDPPENNDIITADYYII